MPFDFLTSRAGWRTLALALFATLLVYWSGLYGGWLFDDFPNIVDNHGVQPAHGDFPSLVRAALSSPASDFKRPLASLSFAANFLASGLDPYWMKLTNLIIHLLNGVLVFLVARTLLREFTGNMTQKDATLAAFIAASWLLLPINLTSVLYVVQRMESMANLFVLLGLLGYVHGRRVMREEGLVRRGFALCAASITLPVLLGVLAKETAVMLPLYACLVEYFVYGFRTTRARADRGLIALFVLVLAIPAVVGLAKLMPGLLRPEAWATRDFTLETRLLSEPRVVLDYIQWTLIPTPQGLSFYHDDYLISSGLLSPWTTLPSLLGVIGLVILIFWLRARLPLTALGLSLFLGCHLLTATVLPLELIYEHRNYFASLGVLLAVAGLLFSRKQSTTPTAVNAGSLAMVERSGRRLAILGTWGLLFAWWTTVTTTTAYAWGDPLLLSRELAARGPESPRAQYELGRTYIIYSHYNRGSPFVPLAYEALERAAQLPKSSILPQQALIFMNARMDLPQKAQWWDSMTAKLTARPPGIQDESSLGALAQCASDGGCDLPKQRMKASFEAALAHPNPSARLLNMYGQYAWNVLDDRELGLRMITAAANTAPDEAAYKITLVRMLVASGRTAQARQTLDQLRTLNLGGKLDDALAELQAMPGLR